jgi:anti-sigma B factor antagonist
VVEWKSFPVVVSGSWSKVTLPPEVDLSCAADMTVALDTAMTGGVDVVVVDMGATTFCDSAGVKVLVQARKRAQAAGGKELRLVLPPGKVRRVFELMGVDRLLPVCSTLAEALAGLPAGEAE